MTVADSIAQWFHEKCITHAFGIIGAGNNELFNAIARLAKTEIVCCHHEQAAVMEAGAYYRISGRLSAALVTTGAGSTNAITGVVAAHMDSTPVLVISGNEASKYMDAPTRVLGVQGYDSSAVIEGVCKGSWRFNGMPGLDRAYALALKPRQGPVWIDIAKDVQNAMV